MKTIELITSEYALITGASSGIGKAIAFELAKRKKNLLLVALPETGLSEVASSLIAQFNVDVKFIELDLIETNAAFKLYQECAKQKLRIDILINNAGMGTQSSFEFNSLTELNTMLRLNNEAMVLLTYYFLKELKRNKRSYVLNVGSLASFMCIPGKAVYSATKSFIYSFTQSLRLEVAKYNVQVSCLCPGGTITSQRVLNNIDKISSIARSALQLPEDVARVAVDGMFKKQPLIIPGWHNKMLYKLWQILPQTLVNLILIKIFNNKTNIKVEKLRPKAVAFRSLAA